MSQQSKLPTEALVTRLAVKEGDVLRPYDEAVRLQQRSGRHDPAIRAWSPNDQRYAYQMKTGGELWTWASPTETWEDLAGRAGYAIVRDGEPVEYWMTIMN
jgi:hypothetical protein